MIEMICRWFFFSTVPHFSSWMNMEKMGGYMVCISDERRG